MIRSTLGLALGTALLSGCGEPSAARDDSRPLPVGQLDAAQEAQYGKATAARDAMFGQLMQALASEISTSGLAGAIGVCREVAPQIAESVSQQEGVSIGRTSWKLRNPHNAAPGWAEGLLGERPEEPRVALGPEGELGVTLPVRVMGLCLRCHGAAESIPADVRGALEAHYPEDRATGFAEGDLRGWFWVVVPPAAR